MSDATARYQSLPEAVCDRAQRHGDRTAFTFLADEEAPASLTFQDLHKQAGGIAAALRALGTTGDRALLLYPPGPEFLTAFLGCSYAGWIPVPTTYPKPGRAMPRLDTAAADCAAAAILTDTKTDRGLDPDRLGSLTRQLPRLVTDEGEVVQRTEVSRDPSWQSEIALLQYTSGSTSEPKGVMVTHANLMANVEKIRRKFSLSWYDECDSGNCAVSWLPGFHDMGLIGGMLTPLCIGMHTVYMSPARFLQRPIQWLQAISDYGATVSGGPCFAYQLCADRILPGQEAGLDLSRWSLAFCGSEPIVWRSLDLFARRFDSIGFRSQAFYPCYGLAESTLMVTGGERSQKPTVLHVDAAELARGHVACIQGRPPRSARTLVGCGVPLTPHEVVIVDPETETRLSEGRVGEIWVCGESVARGYWNREEENALRFHAKLKGPAGNGSEAPPEFLRTGDLGFLHDSELFIAGRMREVIILRGRNLYPVDIEVTVQEVLGNDAGKAAAISVDGPRSEALAIVMEVDRHFDVSRFPELVRALRRSIIDQHDVDPRHLLFVRRVTIPVTTSGKIRRSSCRDMFAQRTIQTVHRWDRGSGGEAVPLPMPALPSHPGPGDQDVVARLLTRWLLDWLISRAGLSAQEVDAEKPFAEYGLDSLTSVELSGELEDWSGIEMSPDIAAEHSTAAGLARFLAEQWVDQHASASACASRLTKQ